MSAIDAKLNVFCPLDQIPEQHRIPMPYNLTKYLIDGRLEEWTGAKVDVVSPICTSQDASGKWIPTVIGSHPAFGEVESLAAMESCIRAFNNGAGVWPTMSVAGRIEVVGNFATEMVKRRAEIVNLLMWEICKTHSDAEKEFDRTVKYIRDTIDAYKELDRSGSRFQIEEGILAHIRRAPLGVVLSMGPFNYPLNETFTTLIPALIMGNTLVCKPPKHGILFFAPLIDCFAKTFPAGVVNFVFGSGSTVVTPIVQSGKIDSLAFIGTSRVSDIIRKQHPLPHRLRCILGLDAKNPAIILPCADVELAVKECILGSLSFNGQRCTALKLIFVHKDLAPRFVQRFAEEVNKMKLGLPWTDHCQITPLPEKNKCQTLDAFIQDAKEHGAQVVNEQQGGGHFNSTIYNPAVVYPVTPAMKLFHQEQFGPIIPIAVYEDLETPIKFISESKFGQQCSIFGTNPATLAHFIDPLVNQVCRVNINVQCQRGPDVFPFSGRKDSAEGTLSVSDALRCFSIRTLVASKANESNTKIITSILRDHQSNFLSTDFIF